jgi:ATP-dependent DNA helicase RecG
LADNRPITTLKGIGEKTGQIFARLGIRTVEDLIRYYPVRFIPYVTAVSVSQAQEDRTCAVKACLPAVPRTIRAKNLKITNGKIEDATGSLNVVWYNSPFIAGSLHIDQEYVFCGKVSRRRNGSLVMEHPLVYGCEEYEKLEGSLKPVYPLTRGISQKTIEKAMKQAFAGYAFDEDWMPEDIRERYGLQEYETAVRMMHFPESQEAAVQARKRIAFDEFFKFIYNVRRIKEDEDGLVTDYKLERRDVYEEYCGILPYELTDAQKQAVDEVYTDMCSGRAMNRLIQGDVGSGKTAVALAAMYLCFRNGCQSALMVPTEVLAVQHYEKLTGLFAGAEHKPRIVLVTGSMTAAARRAAYREIAEHEADMIIGTHALIQDALEYDRLALVITDEQHRFGVNQRRTLAQKASAPHIMVMSATPIPRTLAVILYGDLDISVIDSKPSGRLPVKNAVITPKDRGKAYRTILNEVRAGHQAYVICPMVEESESMDAENVTDYAGKLKSIFPDDIMVQCLNGRMKQAEKDKIMASMASGETDVLVSTTVIEVGVDIPNATVMMIENAERFGLAALHQLRGRVGRGGAQSYCVFVRTSDSDSAKKRLAIIESSNDGFYIAGEDLKLRGPGEILGESQSGEMHFEVADIYADADMLQAASQACDYVRSSGFCPDEDEVVRMRKEMDDYKAAVMDKLNL